MALSLIAYAVCIIRKSVLKYKYLSVNKSKQGKDLYTNMRRSSDWFYDHYVFPFTIMPLFLVFFSTFVSITAKQVEQNSLSSFNNLVILFLIVLILYFQISSALRKIQLRAFGVSSSYVHEFLDYDQNSDYQGYQQQYVIVYLCYYIGLSILMMLSIFKVGHLIELILVYVAVYLVILIVWRPYELRTHNFSIIFNQFCVVFLVFSLFLS